MHRPMISEWLVYGSVHSLEVKGHSLCTSYLFYKIVTNTDIDRFQQI